jgi:LPS-assembly lipoprotein
MGGAVALSRRVADEPSSALAGSAERRVRLSVTGSAPRSKHAAHRSGARLVAAGFVIGLAATGLAGCGSGGFQPLYATGGGAAVQKIAELDIAPVPGRVGQRVRNELIFDRSASGDTRPPTKRLDIRLTESLLTTLVQLDGNSTGQTYQIEAVYRIVDLATSRPEYEGRSIARANFERFESIYSNVRAREDAENRAARTIAGEIKTRVAVHLSR